MAVGFPTKVDYATGDVLSAANMNDLSGTVNLLESAQYAAGKNKIINGDFGINQRAFTSTTTTSTFGFDRWYYNASGGTATYSTQAFTVGTAPVAGYEGVNFARLACTIGNDFCSLIQRIEDVRTLAGQTATLSFWAKGTNPATLGSLGATLEQNFGSGGSSSVVLTQQSFVLTANWQRYSLTYTVPSISGKTIGTSSSLAVVIGQGTSTSTDSFTMDLWGVQVEEGSTASPFQTATGTIQGELAACQRYYYRVTSDAANKLFGMGQAYSTTQAYCQIPFPVTMRSVPTALEQNGTAADYRLLNASAVASNLSSVLTFNSATVASGAVTGTIAAGLIAGNATSINSSASGAYLGWSAEL
jgi:hypothetical protein